MSLLVQLQQQLSQSTIVPLSEKERKKVRMSLIDSDPIIQFDRFPSVHSEYELTRQERVHMYNKGKGFYTETLAVPIKYLYTQEQNGVERDNILGMMHSWHLPLPYLMKISDKKYHVIDGHHRIVMQLLAGRKTIQARVDIFR